MYKTLLLLLATSTYLIGEPSAFQAGDLSIDKPYGLTQNEQIIQKNNDKVKQLTRDKNNINSSVEQLQNDLDGLRSVMNGLTQGKQKTDKLIKKILVTQDDLEVNSVAYKTDLERHDNNITSLAYKLETLIKAQNENYTKIKDTFISFETRVALVEKNYVPKKSFDALQTDFNLLRTLITSKFKQMGKGKKAKKAKSAAKLYKEGKAALKAKKYKTAEARFTASIAAKHRPASSHFLAAESYFYQKRYKKALAYYKESYKRYKKASYNAKLFFHMGESLYFLGDKSKARKIFKSIIHKYPKSSYVKSSKKYLKK